MTIMKQTDSQTAWAVLLLVHPNGPKTFQKALQKVVGAFQEATDREAVLKQKIANLQRSKAYAKAEGVFCPYCGQPGVVPLGAPFFEDDVKTTEVFIQCGCGACHETWKETWRLNGVKF